MEVSISDNVCLFVQRQNESVLIANLFDKKRNSVTLKIGRTDVHLNLGEAILLGTDTQHIPSRLKKPVSLKETLADLAEISIPFLLREKKLLRELATSSDRQIFQSILKSAAAINLLRKSNQAFK